ncbi:MAG: PcfJ domain-containing protein [Eubacterium sp.]|nr:PcfJ domain-containing protein [Eubacterium sp.]
MNSGFFSFFETGIFHCPVLNAKETENNYPIIEEDILKVMEDEFLQEPERILFVPFLRKRNTEIYVDLYFFDAIIEGTIVRIVYKPGYCLEEEMERKLISYLHDKPLKILSKQFREFIKRVKNAFPQCDFHDYEDHLTYKKNTKIIGRFMEYLYFSSHPSIKEKLYKAGLHTLAYNLEDLYVDNLLATSLEEMFQMPMKLLRILNRERMYQRIGSYEDSKRVKEVYRHFANRIEETITAAQWDYIEQLYVREGSAKSFSKRLFRYYEKNALNHYTYDEYREFEKNQKRIADYYPVRRPMPESVWLTVRNQKEIISCLKFEEKLNAGIEKHQNDYDFFWEDSKWIVTHPKNIREVTKEAAAQKNCLIYYLFRIAMGDTHILFVRHSDNPGKSFITMEITPQGKIVQAYKACNRKLDGENMRFIEKYAEIKGFEFNPTELYGDVGVDNTGVSEYFRDYLKRHDRIEPIKEQGIQMELADYLY